jgi:hypothetical protein
MGDRQEGEGGEGEGGGAGEEPNHKIAKKPGLL